VDSPPVAGSVSEALAVVADLPAVPSADAPPAADDGDEADDSALASDGAADQPAGKRRKKRKDTAGENAEVGWTQPPSQPPPAN
jgi:hypothetical protein